MAAASLCWLPLLLLFLLTAFHRTDPGSSASYQLACGLARPHYVFIPLSPRPALSSFVQTALPNLTFFGTSRSLSNCRLILIVLFSRSSQRHHAARYGYDMAAVQLHSLSRLNTVVTIIPELLHRLFVFFKLHEHHPTALVSL